ncbi:unnamed protein product [Acanthoscelides obtectus]|uniref:Uncharacterized protein n=1 Tax=Acanthoscelides obtectus TaxID=200917 RepID=A0A9P0MII5_ACAOB|nr:unnamed protein product [Acanthoscelides obtectus]CAK1658907.1 hypothetical protein AOBTE_LOCUS21193 [Acanthoscelides obtectus]
MTILYFAFQAAVFVLGTAVLSFANAGVILPHALYAPGTIAAPYAAFVQGHEGQYIPDHLEHLYDNGQYRPQLRAVPLAPSPYGLTVAGSGLEGQYVHDYTEKLYDDGSYRPELRAAPLALSPYGLTVAGSGLEGQYVPDLTEKFYDDGSYRPGFDHH